MKHCFYKELKMGLSFFGAKREVNYYIKLQNRRHKKKITGGCFLMNSASESQKSTCSEKYFPTEPDFRAHLSKELESSGLGKRVSEMRIRTESLKR